MIVGEYCRNVKLQQKRCSGNSYEGPDYGQSTSEAAAVNRNCRSIYVFARVSGDGEIFVLERYGLDQGDQSCLGSAVSARDQCNLVPQIV